MKIVIPPELKREFQKKCIDQETKMSPVVCALVQGWLDGKFVLDEQDNSADRTTGQDNKT